MGIGDKQRIERERKEKYGRTIAGFFGDMNHWEFYAAETDAVIALADAEIEPLQEQVETDGERIANLLSLRIRSVGLRMRFEEIMSDLAARGTRLLEKQNTGSAQGQQDAGRGEAYREAARLIAEALAATESEPVEYEYTHMQIGGYVASPRWTTAEEATKALRVYTSPENYSVVRRPKPQPWEEVQ